MTSLDTALVRAGEDRELKRISTVEGFREVFLRRGLRESRDSLGLTEAEVEALVELETTVESFKPDVRGKIRFIGMEDAFRAGRGSALAAHTLLWDLLDSGDWAEPAVYKRLGVDATHPKHFLRVVIQDHINKDASTATLWTDAMLFMKDYLYHPYYRNILSLKPGDVPETPYLALLHKFGRYVQIASPCLKAMARYKWSEVGLTWEQLVEKARNFQNMSAKEQEKLEAEGYFDPYGYGSDWSPLPQAYQSLLAVREMLNLVNDVEKSQRQIYNEARNANPSVTPVILPHYVWLHLTAEQVASLRTVSFIHLEGDLESGMVEVRIRLEMWPACPQCKAILGIEIAEETPLVCFDCSKRYLEAERYLERWMMQVADPETGVYGEWEPIKAPKSLDGGMAETLEIAGIVVVSYQFFIEPAKYWQWRADSGIEELAAEPDEPADITGMIFRHESHKGLMIRVTQYVPDDGKIWGTIVESGTCRLPKYHPQAYDDESEPVLKEYKFDVRHLIGGPR